MKSVIWIGITIGGIIGGYIGSLIDRGSGFGFWSILLGMVGSLIGIWSAYKLYR